MANTGSERYGTHRGAFEKNKKKIFATQTACGICGKEVDFSLRYPHPLSACIELNSPPKMVHCSTKTTSKIEQASNQIFLEINSTYYAKDDIENIVKELKTSIEQSEEKVQINISRLDKDLQDKFNTITKYFSFEVDGLIIGQVNNPYKVIIDNDRYSMTLNDVEVLWIDAVTGTVHTPEINATRRIKVLGYVEEMDDEGRIS